MEYIPTLERERERDRMNKVTYLLNVRSQVWAYVPHTPDIRPVIPLLVIHLKHKIRVCIKIHFQMLETAIDKRGLKEGLEGPLFPNVLNFPFSFNNVS